MTMNEDGPDQKLLTVITGLAMTEINALQAELAEARAEGEKLRRLLLRLSMDVRGCWTLEESELRRLLSNTNYNVVADLLEQTRAALAPEAGKDTP